MRHSLLNMPATRKTTAPRNRKINDLKKNVRNMISLNFHLLTGGFCFLSLSSILLFLKNDVGNKIITSKMCAITVLL